MIVVVLVAKYKIVTFKRRLSETLLVENERWGDKKEKLCKR